MSLKSAFGITAAVVTAATAYGAAESSLELQLFPKYKTHSHAFRHRFGLHTVAKYTSDGDKPTYELCSSTHHGSKSMYWVPIAERCVDCNRCYRDEKLSKTKHLIFNRKDCEEPSTWLEGMAVSLNTNSQHWLDAFPGVRFLSKMNLTRQRATPSCPKTEKDRLHPALLKAVNRHNYSGFFSTYRFYISDLPNHVWIWRNDEIVSEHLEALKYVVDLDLTGCRGITDVSALATGNIEKLRLGFCDKITDVSALGDSSIYVLSLSGCRKITDVSSLGNMLTLDLSYCDGVKDVSALGEVYDLNLSHCTGITDVSSLGGVHTLNLSGCTGVTDVSALGGVHTLDLTGCDNLSVDSVYHLTNVKELKLPKHIC